MAGIPAAENRAGAGGVERVLSARLRLMEFALDHSVSEILVATLDELEKLTGSTIGFFHFVSADQRTLSLQAWSTATRATFCKAKGAGLHYDISRAGVWVDCVRRRRPVIHNDYSALPHKKGLPRGHARLVRELCVPVFRNRKIVAILGVGNKPAPYGKADVEVVSLLADLAWDVTERKISEDALRKTTELLEKTFSTTHVGIAYMDQDFNFIRVNPSYARVDDRTPDFFVGKNHFELYPDRGNELIFRDVVRSGRPFSTYSKPFAYREHPERGVSYWDWSLHPIKGPDGHVRELLLTVLDVTQRKKAEETVAKARALLEKTFASLNEALFLVEMPSRTIVMCNAAAERIFGRSQKEMCGRTTQILHISRKNFLAFGRILTSALAEKGVFDGEFRLTRKDGSHFDAELTVAEITDANRRRTHVISVVRDITDRKKAGAELRLYQRRLQAFASRLSAAEERERRRIAAVLHDDVGQRLFMARLKLGTVSVRGLPPDSVRTFAGVLNLLGEAIELTRTLTSELRPPALAQLGLEKAVARLCDDFRSTHKIGCTFERGRRSTRIDENTAVFVYRATRELLLNAAKHSGARCVTVSIRARRGALHVCVRDDGKGIPVGAWAKRSKHDGMGLFSISERLREIGGRLDIGSVRGTGTSVRMILPLKRPKSGVRGG